MERTVGDLDILDNAVAKMPARRTNASGEERLILDVLEATERWLVDHGFPGTKVTAEGKTYTLERPSR